jgi:hypothetical protein
MVSTLDVLLAESRRFWYNESMEVNRTSKKIPRVMRIRMRTCRTREFLSPVKNYLKVNRETLYLPVASSSVIICSARIH